MKLQFSIASFVLLIVAAAAPAYPSDESYLKDQKKTTRSSDGVEIRYDVYGKGEPAIVLVHGWALDRALWEGQVPGLSKLHRVITLDLPGHGESGKNRSQWTMAAFGQDVKAVVDASGAKQVILVGHSMGGPVVLEAARAMREKLKA
jgi:pimeloyl-ACP methyl ester carboxylesterase